MSLIYKPNFIIMKCKLFNFSVKTISVATTLLFAGVLLFTACNKEDDGPVPGDNTDLVALIAEAQDLHDNAVEGTSVGFYQVGSKAELQTVIDAAEVVADNEASTQPQIDGAYASLEAAVTAFEAKKIQDVSTDGLVAQWLFNGDASDNTGNGNDGEEKVGYTGWGAGSPVLTTDRFGNEDAAYYFDKGANIEIPYSTALNPASISLSWWIYMEERPNNDYMISMKKWNCYKVNLQEANKVFFTTKVEDPASPGDFIYNDRDHAGDGLEAGRWYHLVVTYGGGHMVFYIDGENVMDWDNVPDSRINDISAEPWPLVLGQQMPTSEYTDQEGDGDFFKGKMDDFRLYNRVLSEQEVSSIYTLEKP